MGTCQINHRLGSDVVSMLEGAGLTPEMASRAVERGLGTTMVTALAAALGIAPIEPPQTKSLAARRRSWWKRHLKRQGIRDIIVPIPNVTDDEINRRAAFPIPQKLFFKHFKNQADYDAFMAAVGQANHWTVTDEKERAKIGWEFSGIGYWFWAEVAPSCPRLETSWNDLTKSIRLLSLEEYVIVWHATKAETQVMLDGPTWCWLRTRYDVSGALRADGDGGGVHVFRYDAEFLSVPYGSVGGRSAEVVKN